MELSEYIKMGESPMQRFLCKLKILDNIVKISLVDSEIGSLRYLEVEHTPANQDVSLIQSKSEFGLKKYRVSSSIPLADIKNFGDLGVDYEEMLKSVLYDEAAQIIVKNSIEKIKSSSKIFVHPPLNSLEKLICWIKKIFYRICGKKYDPSHIKIKDPGEIWREITKASHQIGRDGKMGMAQFIICSAGINSILSDFPGYVFNHFSTNERSFNFLTNPGTMGGMQIFVDQYMKWFDSTVFVCKKTGDNENGIHVPILKGGLSVDSKFDDETQTNHITLEIKTDVIGVGSLENKYRRINFKLSGGLKDLWEIKNEL